MSDVRETAPAKINLALHVTGRREDGYHLLDSLVTFADQGDVVSVSRSEQDAFTLSGPFSAALRQESLSDNLVVRARDLLRTAVLEHGGSAPAVAIHLEKSLPIASGIGGGSADAAATLRALLRLWGTELPAQTLQALAVKLGADVPMCLNGRPLRATGIGETVTPVPTLPSFGLLLGNPLKSVSTPAIFKAMTRRDFPPIATLPTTVNPQDWLAALANMRNDLEPVARALCPEIEEISTLIASTGAELTRMSGSGATCFGLYPSLEKAEKAKVSLRAVKPEWYFQAFQSVSEV